MSNSSINSSVTITNTNTTTSTRSYNEILNELNFVTKSKVQEIISKFKENEVGFKFTT